MIQFALQLLRMSIEQSLRAKFGIAGLALLGQVHKIANVQQLKKILHAVSKARSADDIKKLIQGYHGQQTPMQQ